MQFHLWNRICFCSGNFVMTTIAAFLLTASLTEATFMPLLIYMLLHSPMTGAKTKGIWILACNHNQKKYYTSDSVSIIWTVLCDTFLLGHVLTNPLTQLPSILGFVYILLHMLLSIYSTWWHTLNRISLQVDIWSCCGHCVCNLWWHCICLSWTTGLSE